jgi:formate hydrogenlyase subunit 3/multisubunit Na+/H+ antiporter MnhD subunit
MARMFSLAQLLLIAILAPLIAGLFLVIAGSRIARSVALSLAIVAAFISSLSALTLTNDISPVGPQLVPVITLGTSSVVQRFDGFSVALLIGISLIVQPVLIWITTPRSPVDRNQGYSTQPMGFSLIAASLAIGAVLDDNIVLATVCWILVALVAWIIARPLRLQLPENANDWFDLALMTSGPIFFLLFMLFPMTSAKTTSMLGLTGATVGGQSVFSVPATFLIVVALSFAGGLWPFAIWIRRVVQGIMTEAIAVLLLLVTPVSAVMLARLLASFGTWPVFTLGALRIGLNAVPIIFGVASVLVGGVVALFESDLPVMTAFGSLVPMGWMFVALGATDDRALLGFAFLLLAYSIGVGVLMIIWSSLEWDTRELTVDGMRGLAQSLPFHFIALVLASLTLVGAPLFASYSGMALIDNALLKIGGSAALAGVLLWLGNGLALIGFIRPISSALRQVPVSTPVEEVETQVEETEDGEILEAEIAVVESSLVVREGGLLIIPSIIILLLSIAPELLLLQISHVTGVLQLAAQSLLPGQIDIPNVATTTLGWNIGGIIWLPGLFWLIAVGIVAISLIASGAIRSAPAPSPVFAGGEPFELEDSESFNSWHDLSAIARSPIVFPGPYAWRNDLGANDEDELADSEEEANDDLADEEDEDSVEVEEVDIEEEIVLVEGTASEEEEEPLLDADHQPYIEVDASVQEITPEVVEATPEIIDENVSENQAELADENGTESQAEPADENDEPAEESNQPIKSMPPTGRANRPYQPSTRYGGNKSNQQRKGGKGGKSGRR